jgi:thiosulfate dehydrogenase (quinone) large subunit
VEAITRRAETLNGRCRGPALGLARITVGLLWLANIHWKVPSDFGEASGGGLLKYSESVNRNSPFAPFTWVTEEIILPNFGFFGWFTLVIETALAMLLIIGYRTRLAALAGAAMSIPIALSVLYYDRADEWSWAYILMFAAHIMVWASDAGAHLGVDGVLRRRDPNAARRAITTIGVITTVIGVAGLFVSRSVSFTGRQVALLGSDAGFVDADSQLVRRWELKFLWFNPLWAILTIVAGVLLLVAMRQLLAARVAGIGLIALAAVVFATRTFDYVRDDDVLQQIATGSNAAVWGGLGLAALLFERAARRTPGDTEVRDVSGTSRTT